MDEWDIKKFRDFLLKTKEILQHTWVVVHFAYYYIIKFLKELVFKTHQRIIPSQLAVIKIASGQEINQMEFNFICFPILFA